MVQLEYRGKVISVVKGTILRSALLRNGTSPHNGRAMYANCRGLGTCGTCAVQVIGKVVPDQWGPLEKVRLNFPPHKAPGNERLRLACQVRVDGDLTVVKYNKMWGQGDEPLGPASDDEFKLPLGNLEYVFDPTKDLTQSSTKVDPHK